MVTAFNPNEKISLIEEKRMYIETKDSYQCSQCLTTDFYEWVHRGNDQIIRCRRCGHERVWSTTTTYNEGGIRTTYDFTVEANIPPTKF